MDAAVCRAEMCYPFGRKHGRHWAMKRREFITLIGAAAWPLAARAQSSERVRRIGALMYLAADDPESPARVVAFARGLQEFGWIEGRNIQIEYRWGGGDMDRVRRYAAEIGCFGAGCHPGQQRLSFGSAAKCNPHCANRLCERHRSCRRWIRRKPFAPGRQYNRIHPVRIRHKREMARAA